MQCRVIVLDTTGTVYTFYEREKTKKTKKNKPKRDRRMKEQKMKKVSCLSGGVVADDRERAIPPHIISRVN